MQLEIKALKEEKRETPWDTFLLHSPPSSALPPQSLLVLSSDICHWPACWQHKAQILKASIRTLSAFLLREVPGVVMPVSPTLGRQQWDCQSEACLCCVGWRRGRRSETPAVVPLGCDRRSASFHTSVTPRLEPFGNSWMSPRTQHPKVRTQMSKSSQQQLSTPESLQTSEENTAFLSQQTHSHYKCKATDCSWLITFATSWGQQHHTNHLQTKSDNTAE